MVIHSAAWTDVDGCALDPQLAMRRNATATGELASACVAAGVDLVLISTNEVFDGARTDGRGYREQDDPGPINAYGRSKLAGEDAARRAGPARLWIVRTAWLFGPPGADFPAKIVAASDRLPPGEPLRVVADEVGSPTFTRDLAAGIAALLDVPPDTYHLTSEGSTSRADWAEAVLAATGRRRAIQRIGQRAFERPSRPPLWGVLDTSRARAAGVTLRPWREALGDYLASRSTPR
jgi:dTDP-4-dehydrorhamnose reductase